MADLHTYTAVDKTGWGDGPWRNEPDKVHWIDPATDLDCLIVRSGGVTGSLCGYVGVPPGHPAHGKDYDDVDVEVHGGLTYGDLCQKEAPPERGVCHIPAPGRPADVYWLGFDCAHAFDLCPAMRARESELGMAPVACERGDVYRDIDYVRNEVTHLAAQLAAMGS